MSTSSPEPTRESPSENWDTGQPKRPGFSLPETTTTSRSILPERIEARRRDPEFQKRLKQNINRHKEVLDRLADS